jgi:hypothetical protein
MPRRTPQSTAGGQGDPSPYHEPRRPRQPGQKMVNFAYKVVHSDGGDEEKFLCIENATTYTEYSVLRATCTYYADTPIVTRLFVLTKITFLGPRLTKKSRAPVHDTDDPLRSDPKMKHPSTRLTSLHNSYETGFELDSLLCRQYSIRASLKKWLLLMYIPLPSFAHTSLLIYRMDGSPHGRQSVAAPTTDHSRQAWGYRPVPIHVLKF